MAEPDTSDDLQTQIEAAQLADNPGLANELYMRQLGSEPADNESHQNQIADEQRPEQALSMETMATHGLGVLTLPVPD